MAELYRIHFGFYKSNRYSQAVELSKLAFQHETRGEGEDIWHIVSFTESQIDLMAALYKLLVGKSAISPCFMRIPRPKIQGADILSITICCRKDGQCTYSHNSQKNKERVICAAERLKLETGRSFQDVAKFLEDTCWEPLRKDIATVEQRIIQEGYIDYKDPVTGRAIKATREPKEYVTQYQEVRELIARSKYKEAVNRYYAILGDRFYGELHGELIYLKHLAKIPLTGRDLLYFRNESSRVGLVSSHLPEYVDCIDKALSQLEKMGRKSLLDIMLEYAPTMEKMIENREYDWNKGVYLWDGDFKMNSAPVTLDNFSTTYDACPEGRLFDRYPDQVQHCRIIEYPDDKTYLGLWTNYSPHSYQQDIIDKGLHLSGIEAYRYKLWRRGKRDPDFTTIKSMTDIKKANYGTNGIRYTGRTHTIDGLTFYEINLIRRNVDRAKYIGNPFTELVNEVLREAENLLRERRGLPKIGEGWVSEIQLYNLIKTVYSEVQHHATPEWLKPQHLDIFVPSRNLAIEYQGKQHFEPVDFFGGEESLQHLQILDQRKMQKCKLNKVVLVYWRYDEPINTETLAKKLGAMKDQR